MAIREIHYILDGLDFTFYRKTVFILTFVAGRAPGRRLKYYTWNIGNELRNAKRCFMNRFGTVSD